MPVPGPLALCHGCFVGQSARAARLLAGDSHDLIVVARRRERLEALAAELRSRAGAESRSSPPT